MKKRFLAAILAAIVGITGAVPSCYASDGTDNTTLVNSTSESNSTDKQMSLDAARDRVSECIEEGQMLRAAIWAGRAVALIAGARAGRLFNGLFGGWVRRRNEAGPEPEMTPANDKERDNSGPNASGVTDRRQGTNEENNDNKLGGNDNASSEEKVEEDALKDAPKNNDDVSEDNDSGAPDGQQGTNEENNDNKLGGNDNTSSEENGKSENNSDAQSTEDAPKDAPENNEDVSEDNDNGARDGQQGMNEENNDNKLGGNDNTSSEEKVEEDALKDAPENKDEVSEDSDDDDDDGEMEFQPTLPRLMQPVAKAVMVVPAPPIVLDRPNNIMQINLGTDSSKLPEQMYMLTMPPNMTGKAVEWRAEQLAGKKQLVEIQRLHDSWRQVLQKLQAFLKKEPCEKALNEDQRHVQNEQPGQIEEEEEEAAEKVDNAANNEQFVAIEEEEEEVKEEVQRPMKNESVEAFEEEEITLDLSDSTLFDSFNRQPGPYEERMSNTSEELYGILSIHQSRSLDDLCHFIFDNLDCLRSALRLPDDVNMTNYLKNVKYAKDPGGILLEIKEKAQKLFDAAHGQTNTLTTSSDEEFEETDVEEVHVVDSPVQNEQTDQIEEEKRETVPDVDQRQVQNEQPVSAEEEVAKKAAEEEAAQKAAEEEAELQADTNTTAREETPAKVVNQDSTDAVKAENK